MVAPRASGSKATAYGYLTEILNPSNPFALSITAAEEAVVPGPGREGYSQLETTTADL